MSNNIDFTDRERFLLQYFRDPRLSSWSRSAALEGILIALSLCFIGLHVGQHDAGWGFAGYLLLLWRVGASVWRTRRYLEDYRSIFAKYEAKLKELTDVEPTRKLPNEV